MRLCLPLALLTFLPAAALCSQAPLPLAGSPVAQSTTLIDALNADKNYTRLLALLQRARLVPTLNRLNGSTFFAPTNAAIEQHPLWRSARADNIQAQLRAQLFYHLTNYTVGAAPAGAAVQELDTLHFPRTPREPPTHEPPPSPPWMPVPGGALGGAPQRLRWAARDGATWVGTDYAGRGGVRVVQRRVDTDNGVLYGIGAMLQPPHNLSHQISQRADLAYFQRLLPGELRTRLATAPNLTLFLPQDAAWKALDPIKLRYLESGFAGDELQMILGMHTILTDTVVWSDSFKKSTKYKTVHGDKLTISVDGNKTKVGPASLVEPDIYASNGVLHVVSDLLMPPDALQLTPEKYLIALNCTTFVSLLRSVSLSSLVNTTNASYTILAPRDDVILLGGGGSLPGRGSAALARLLRYHFLPGLWTAEQLEDGKLVQTALEEEGLRGGKQVLDVGVTGTGESPELTFGGAGVIGKPLQVNNTIIYLISRTLIPPGDVLQMALPSLQFSTFLASVFATSLAERLKREPSITLLIPQNTAFERLGLVAKHLLSSSSQADLENVILHHAVNKVAYLDVFQNGSQKTYGTLDGSDVGVARANGSAWVAPSGGWDGMRGRVVAGNVLTQTGVIHELSGVLLPRSVEITVGKLTLAAGGTTMEGLVVKAGMAWVLNGTAPPAGSEWAAEGLGGAGWTLLCPTDASFKGVNMTRLWADEHGMRRLVAQHLIPGPPAAGSIAAQALAESDDPNRPIYLDGGATYSTLLSRRSFYGDVVFRQADAKNPAAGYVVGIKGARGTGGENDWANVLSWGRSTAGGGAGGGAVGGVVQIDGLLVPYEPAWWRRYGPPFAVGAGGVVVMGAFFWAVAYFWRRESGEATYEPVGGFDREDAD